MPERKRFFLIEVFPNFNRMICSFSVNTVDLAPNAMNNQLCQADLGDRRVVSPKAGSEMAAALGLQYFESSAKDQTGVEVRSPSHLTEQLYDGRSPQKILY